ncbi:MAG: hypothetical protein KC594_16310, partial [Nitrospira sp.]|nr:hypothetical protein [Nitrospira sp.]
NYSVTDQTSTTANITAASLTLSGTTGLDKVYDGTTNLPTGQTGYGTLGGLLGSDVVTLTGTPVYSDKNVGARTIQQGTVGLQGADAGNYSLAWTNGNGSITQAPLTIRANPSAKFVTEADPAGFHGISVEGLVNGETTSVLSGTAVVSRSDSGNNAIGTHSSVLVPSGLSATNYSLTYVNGDFRIVPAEQLLVEVASTPTSTFGTTPTYTVSSARYLNNSNTIIDLTGNVSANGNTVTLTDGAGGNAAFTLTALNPLTSTGGHLQVGTYQVGSNTITESSANFSDTVTFVGTHTVTPKTVTVPTTQVSKTYDGTTAMPDLMLGLTGLASGDVVNVTGTGTYATPQVGTGLTYTLSSIALSGSDAGNYVTGGSLSRTDGIITQKLLTRQGLTANDRVYTGGTAATLSNVGTLAGVVHGDTVSSDGSGATAMFADKNVGTNKVVTVTGLGLGGADASNYTVSATDSTTASITRLGTVTWTGGATGDWFDPANWAGGAVPDLANVEAVTIPTGVTVTFNDQSVTPPAQTGTVEITSLGTNGGLAMQQGTLQVGTGGVTLNSLDQTGGTVSSTGDIMLGRFTQSSGSTSTQGNFTTTQEYDQPGTGTVTVGGTTTLTDTSGGLRLGNLSSTGPLVVTSTDGDITQTSGTTLTAGSTSQFTARTGGQPADILLPNPGNDFLGLVDLNGRNITIVDGNGGLQTGTVTSTGQLALTGVDSVAIENSVVDTLGGISSQTGVNVIPPVGTPATLPAVSLEVLTTVANAGSTNAPLPLVVPTLTTLASPIPQTTIIQEVKDVTPYGPGLITISLPRDRPRDNTGFLIEFPESIKQTLSTFTGTFELAHDQPLPAWLTYEAADRRFRLTSPPPSAFPLEMKIKTGGRELMVVFSEQN